jgi:NAD(P)-dependent dehydrogenase (short-subunit alcohol dehydrogenase family)
MEDLRGRVIIVTGASRGIGKGLALGLAQLGASVVCAARTQASEGGPDALPGSIAETADAIRAAGGTALAIRCDIGEPADIEDLVETTVRELGRIDVLVNNAMAGTRVSFDESTVEQWDTSMRINVRSLYLLCRAVVPHMTKQGGGSIVNISSGGAAHASTPFMPPGYLFYVVAKAAMERFTSAIAPELRPFGITVNALRPGAVKTEMSTRELGEDFDWSSWTTPDAVVAPVAALAARIDTDFTGRVVDVSGFGKTWPE